MGSRKGAESVKFVIDLGRLGYTVSYAQIKKHFSISYTTHIPQSKNTDLQPAHWSNDIKGEFWMIPDL